MRSLSYIRFLVFVISVTYSLSIFSQEIQIDYPASVCPGEPVYFENQTPDMYNHDWLWFFCKADPDVPPVGDAEMNLDDLLTSPVYLSLNQNLPEETVYYCFINNYSDQGTSDLYPGKITRYMYPTLDGQPQEYRDLIIPDMPKSLEGLQIVQDVNGTSEWYGFIVGGNPSYTGGTTPSYLARLDFGSSLANPSPELTILIEDDDFDTLNFPHDLYIFYDNESASPMWHGFTVNKLNGTIARFDFTSGINEMPVVHNLGNPDDRLSRPVGIFPIQDNGLWYVFVTDNDGDKGLFRLDFGEDILNPYPDCTPVPIDIAGGIVHMRDISLFRSCNQVYGYIVAGHAYDEFNLVKLNFADITTIPDAVTFGTLGYTIEFGHSISDIFRVDDDYYAMVCNHGSKNITRLILPSCESIPSVSQDVQPQEDIIYADPGWKTIEVIKDFGTAQQDNECFDIFVEYPPVLADTIHGPVVVCPGDTVIFNSNDLAYTDPDGYLWGYDHEIVRLNPANTFALDTVVITRSIHPGPHLLTLQGENRCGTGPIYTMTIQVDTSTSITHHPIDLISAAVNDDATLGVNAYGSDLSYQWQESTDGGVVWYNLPDEDPYYGVYTDELVIRDVQAAMTGYKFRCIVTGSCDPIEIYSGECILVVGALLTTVGISDAAACPETDISVPIKIAGFAEVTDFSLKLFYADDLAYNGFSNPHAFLSDISVTNRGSGELIISWAAEPGPGVTILSGQMLELNFHTHVGDVCDFQFVEAECEYNTGDIKLDDEYTAYSFTILPLPEKPLQPTGNRERCEGVVPEEYTIAIPLHTDTYSWSLNPDASGVVSNNGNSVTVNWDPFFHGEAWIKVKGLNGCGEGAYSDSLKVITHPLPLKAALPVGDTNLCEAGPDQFYFTDGGQYSTSYVWTLLPPEAGTVSGNGQQCAVTWNPSWVGFAELTALAVNDCGEARQNSEPLLIDVNPLPALQPWVSDTVAYLDAPVSFSAEVWRGTAPYRFNWDFMPEEWYSSTPDTTIIPDDPYHEYVLTVIDSNSCTMTSKIGVKILLPLFVPNAFTPDQDGLNDLFRGFITGNVEGVSYRLLIFSRVGTQVYEERGDDLSLMSGWDGTYEGTLCSSGVYVYYLYYEIMGYDGIEGEQLIKGTFTLLR